MSNPYAPCHKSCETITIDCENCGAVYNVSIPKQDGHNESEEYYCPECRNKRTARACNSPQVDLVSPRTDGK